jgi:Trk-type K+ transport system membrane component
LPLWRSALCAVVGESARTTSATIALANVTSAGALMPEQSGEPNKVLVMVFMVIGVPPFSMVGRHDGHKLAAQTCEYRSK